MRSPSFHWPRFLSSSVRSKRLRTFRLPPKVAAARRLRCCDINTELLNRSIVKPPKRFRPPPRFEADGAYSTNSGRMPMVYFGICGRSSGEILVISEKSGVAELACLRHRFNWAPNPGASTRKYHRSSKVTQSMRYYPEMARFFTPCVVTQRLPRFNPSTPFTSATISRPPPTESPRRNRAE